MPSLPKVVRSRLIHSRSTLLPSSLLNPQYFLSFEYPLRFVCHSLSPFCGSLFLHFFSVHFCVTPPFPLASRRLLLQSVLFLLLSTLFMLVKSSLLYTESYGHFIRSCAPIICHYELIHPNSYIHCPLYVQCVLTYTVHSGPTQFTQTCADRSNTNPSNTAHSNFTFFVLTEAVCSAQPPVALYFCDFCL